MALFSKALPKTYPELCAVYLPRAIGDKVALSKALEAINALNLKSEVATRGVRKSDGFEIR